jgi:hypothetical protein
MKQPGRYTIGDFDKENGTIFVTFFNYAEDVLKEKEVSKDRLDLWESSYNIPIPIEDNSYITGEKLINHIENYYPWFYFEEENKKLTVKNIDFDEIIPKGFEGIIENKENPAPEVKGDLSSLYGSETDVQKIKHIIYETLEELGLLK